MPSWPGRLGGRRSPTRLRAWVLISALLGVTAQAEQPALAHGEQVLFIVGGLGLALLGGLGALVLWCERPAHKLLALTVLLVSAVLSWVAFVPSTIGESAKMSAVELVFRTASLPLLATIATVLALRRIERRQGGTAA